jgi:hypothetical protein
MPTEYKDLFVKQREPKDYVSFPPQETPTLEKFFAERQTPKPQPTTNANMFGSNFLDKKKLAKSQPVKGKEVAQSITPELQAVADASPKLEPETLAKAKAMFQVGAANQPTPEMAEQEPTVQASNSGNVIASDLVDTEQIKRQRDDLMGPDTTTQDLIVGGIPVLMDLLMNKGRGDGMQVGADYMMNKGLSNEKRRDSLEDKLMTMSNSRAIAAAKGKKGGADLAKASNVLPVVGPDGTTQYNWVADAVGKQKPADTKSSMDRGEISRLNREQQKQLADRQAILNTRDKLVGNKTFQGARARFQATNDAVDVLNQRNPVGDAGVQILFAKGIFGEVGNLTAQEQAKFIGSPELERTFNRMVEKYKNGTLAEEDRASLLKLATHMRQRAKEVAGEAASGYTSGLKSLGIDPSGVIDPLLSGREVQPQYKAKEKYIRQGGVVYTLDESTGEYK